MFGQIATAGLTNKILSIGISGLLIRATEAVFVRREKDVLGCAHT